MKKEEIYVVIDSEEKRLKALEILEKAGEKIWKNSLLKSNTDNFYRFLVFNLFNEGIWGVKSNNSKTKISLEQLEQLLIPMSPIDQLKQQAEALGFELVEKKREIKVGDFGVFWYDDKINEHVILYDFLSEIENDKFVDVDGNVWDNFRYLTDEEKEKIQNNW